MSEEHLRISGIQYDSLADGEGVRAALFLSGCRHNCKGCHNPAAQSPESGKLITPELVEEIAGEINRRSYLSGITLTGGDPLYDPEQTMEFLLQLKSRLTNPGLTVWLFTGDAWESISDLPIMSHVDIVVDGPFIQEQADKRLVFRGSLNQRIIDVEASKRNGSVVLWKG